MKNQTEIYQALLDGEILINHGRDRVILKNGRLYSLDKRYANYAFSEPENWQIYKDPKWYEKDSAIGSLCEFWNDISKVKIVDRFTKTVTCNNRLAFMAGDDIWSGIYENARQLTKQEIQIFMDSAPEEE